MSSTIACSLCRSICSESCYERHSRRYACHNRECGLHYPENIVVDRETFFLGAAETYSQHQPSELGRRSSRNGESHGQITNWQRRDIVDGVQRARSPPQMDSYIDARSRCRSSFEETNNHAAFGRHYRAEMGTYDLFEGPTLCGESEDKEEEDSAAQSITLSYVFTSIPDSRDHHHRSIRRGRSQQNGHRHADSHTLPSETDAAVCLDSPRRPLVSRGFRRAVSSLFCGLPLGTGRRNHGARERRSVPRERDSRPQGEQTRGLDQSSGPLEGQQSVLGRNARQSSQTTVSGRTSDGQGQENEDNQDDDEDEVSRVELPQLRRQLGRPQEQPTAGSSTELPTGSSGAESARGTTTPLPRAASPAAESSQGGTTWLNGKITLVKRGPGDYTVRGVTMETVRVERL